MSDSDRPFEANGEARPDEEWQELSQIGELLSTRRPTAPAGMRESLRARLLAAARYIDRRPRNLRALVATYALCGLTLLGAAAFGVAGIGPLAPQVVPASSPLPPAIHR
jgi:hypothetical protein